MKKVILGLLVALSFMSCEKEEMNGSDFNEATILGRWVPEGFDDVVRYEFTEDKRFTIYGTGDGVFPTLEEFMAENPQLTGHDWDYDGETVVVDLNFGNYSRLVPNFKCGNEVVDWVDEVGGGHSTFYREGHDLASCN